MKKSWLTMVLICLTLLPAWGRGEETSPLPVMASFSILADLVKQVGGDKVVVKTLVGIDSDAHVYQPTPADAVALANARVFVINGLGFEGWMERLIHASGFKGKLITASQHVAAMGGKEGETDHHHHHTHEAADPHTWHDVNNVVRYVANIRDGLSATAPDLAEDFRQNAQRYQNQLTELDQWIRQEIATVAVSKRKVVTSHDAFGYFSRAYGVDFLAPVGLSNDAEPSASGVAKLIRQMKKEGVTAIFVENMTDPRLVQQLAQEAGAKVGGLLYADALSGPQGGAPTYVELMRHNVTRLKQAMQQSP